MSRWPTSRRSRSPAEPGPDLQRVHAAILRQDPGLLAPAACELPPELEHAAAAAPLIGREPELRALLVHWRRAVARHGELVTLAGAYGMGKTRLAAELACTVHAEGATVLAASGAGPSEVALAAIARAAAAEGPTLLILDDADRASADVGPALRADGPVLIVATGLETEVLAALCPDAALVLEPLAEEAVAAGAALYAPPAAEIPAGALLAISGGPVYSPAASAGAKRSSGPARTPPAGARRPRRTRGRPVRGGLHGLPGRGGASRVHRRARSPPARRDALRADFYVRCAAYPELSRALGANHVLVRSGH